MLTEHQPNYDRLEDIFLHSPEELLFRHIREPWHDDKAVLRELMTATTAMLVAHDTQTDKERNSSNAWLLSEHCLLI